MDSERGGERGGGDDDDNTSCQYHEDDDVVGRVDIPDYQLIDNPDLATFIAKESTRSHKDAIVENPIVEKTTQSDPTTPMIVSPRDKELSGAKKVPRATVNPVTIETPNATANPVTMETPNATASTSNTDRSKIFGHVKEFASFRKFKDLQDCEKRSATHNE